MRSHTDFRPCRLWPVLLLVAAPLFREACADIADIQPPPHLFVLSTQSNVALSSASPGVLAEAYEALGIEIRIQTYPHSRSAFAANEGWVDGELQRTAGLDSIFPNLVRVPAPIGTTEAVVVTRDPCLRIGNWQALRPYRIGVIRGSLLVERRTRGMRVTRATEIDDLLAMILAGHVDVGLVSRFAAMERMADPKYTGLHILEPPLEAASLYHYLNRRHQNLVAPLQGILEKMQRRGRIAELERKVLARSGYRRPPPDCSAGK